MLLFNAVICAGTAAARAAVKFRLRRLLTPLMIYCTAAITVAYRQLLILFSAPLALTSGFSLYVTAFCAYQTGGFTRTGAPLRERLAEKMKESALFSAAALALFLFRELFGAASLSLPAPPALSPSGIAALEIPLPRFLHSLAFIASIPGAVLTSALLMTAAGWFLKRRARHDA